MKIAKRKIAAWKLNIFRKSNFTTFHRKLERICWFWCVVILASFIEYLLQIGRPINAMFSSKVTEKRSKIEKLIWLKGLTNILTSHLSLPCYQYYTRNKYLTYNFIITLHRIKILMKFMAYPWNQNTLGNCMKSQKNFWKLFEAYTIA